MFCVEEHKWGYFTRIYIGVLIPRVYIGTLATRRPQMRTRCLLVRGHCLLVRGHCLLVREHYLLVRTRCLHTYIYYLEILIDFSALHAPFKEIDMANCTLE